MCIQCVLNVYLRSYQALEANTSHISTRQWSIMVVPVQFNIKIVTRSQEAVCLPPAHIHLRVSQICCQVVFSLKFYCYRHRDSGEIDRVKYGGSTLLKNVAPLRLSHHLCSSSEAWEPGFGLCGKDCWPSWGVLQSGFFLVYDCWFSCCPFLLLVVFPIHGMLGYVAYLVVNFANRLFVSSVPPFQSAQLHCSTLLFSLR